MNRFSRFLANKLHVLPSHARELTRARMDAWCIPSKKPIHYDINERANLAARLARVCVDGKYGAIVEGMDCDCSQYRRESVREMPKSLFAYWHALREDEQWLDGPQSVRYCRPDEVRDGYHKSSDRALEAYEDGHPHRVTWADLS